MLLPAYGVGNESLTVRNGLINEMSSNPTREHVRGLTPIGQGGSEPGIVGLDTLR